MIWQRLSACGKWVYFAHARPCGHLVYAKIAAVSVDSGDFAFPAVPTECDTCEILKPRALSCSPETDPRQITMRL
jgi:hypothetical protein